MSTKTHSVYPRAKDPCRLVSGYAGCIIITNEDNNIIWLIAVLFIRSKQYTQTTNHRQGSHFAARAHLILFTTRVYAVRCKSCTTYKSWFNDVYPPRNRCLQNIDGTLSAALDECGEYCSSRFHRLRRSRNDWTAKAVFERVEWRTKNRWISCSKSIWCIIILL